MKLSEIFYSIQGEGLFTGVPAIFIRVPNCNLRCNGKWKCDTWDLLGKDQDINVGKFLNTVNIQDDIDSQRTHIVFTGGEPFMQQYQDQLIYLIGEYFVNAFIEIETNGTMPLGNLKDYVNHITCSPKLSNAGMSKNTRINLSVLHDIKTHSSYCFKFVVNNIEDLQEVQEIVQTVGIPKHKVYLMPAGSTRKQLLQNLPKVWNYCLHYGYRISTRLHIEAFDKKTGI